jgi:hypothetical protein
MPLGVSEGLIKQAYGAVDFSGLYKTLDAFSKKVSVDEKAYKDAAMKDYIKNVSQLNVEQKGARSSDMPLLMKHAQDYKDAALQLSRNPNLINTDIETYRQLNDKMNQAFGSHAQLSALSKQYAQEIPKTKEVYWNPSTRDNYTEDARKTINDVENLDSYTIREKGLLDRSKFIRQDLDLTKPLLEVNKAINDVSNKATERTKINTITGGDKLRYNQEYTLGKIPSFDNIHTSIANSWSSSLGGDYSKINKASKQALQPYESEDGLTVKDNGKAIHDFVINTPEQKLLDLGLPKDLFAKFIDPKDKSERLHLGDTPLERFVNYKSLESLKSYINNQWQPKGKPSPLAGDLAKERSADYRSNLLFSSNLKDRKAEENKLNFNDYIPAIRQGDEKVGQSFAENLSKAGLLKGNVQYVKAHNLSEMSQDSKYILSKLKDLYPRSSQESFSKWASRSLEKHMAENGVYKKIPEDALDNGLILQLTSKQVTDPTTKEVTVSPVITAYDPNNDVDMSRLEGIASPKVDTKKQRVKSFNKGAAPSGKPKFTYQGKPLTTKF